MERTRAYSPFLWLMIPCLFCPVARLDAQEGTGQAETSFQQYYLAIDSHRVANISGLGMNFSQFIPDTGLVSGSLLPATSNGTFRNGDSYLRLKGLPWKGQHWTFTIGDFRVPGQLLPVPFTNITNPEIAARGGSIEATHGKRTVGFFFGEGTISNTPRIILRQQVPQTLMGAYWRQGIGARLQLGARFMHFSNDVAALRKLPNFVTQNPLTSAATLSLDSLYTIAGPLKMYAEATWSMAAQEGPNLATRNVPVSVFAGPAFETKALTLSANYTFQNASYFPVLGYYLGDRAGPFGEIKYRPFGRLEIYASASEYENNVARDPTLADFHSTSESAGASVQLPGNLSLNAQFTKLDLGTRTNAVAPWLKSADQQKSVSLSRPFAGHNIRVSVREFQDISPTNSQQQRTLEIEDNFHIRSLTLGAGARLQNVTSSQSRSSVFYHGSANYRFHRLSAYGNFETGNDLQNKTLLATNTVSTTIAGLSLSLGKSWELQAEAYRNNLLTELNPQSIFVLQGQGVFVPGTLAALNQWSMYFHVTRKFHWGKAIPMGDLAQYSAGKAQLKGSLEGFVMEHLADGNYPAEGVTVSVDQSRTALTDADGHFRLADVPEGPHRIALAVHELPAEFEVGKNIESALIVQPGKLSRADFDVVRLSSLGGRLTGPKDVPVDGIVVRMQPGGQYTTPDTEGNFSFYNVRAGVYMLTVDVKTLPEFGVLTQKDGVSVTIGAAGKTTPVAFDFEIHKPQKPVRNVLDKK
jgi:hypothetical protein